MVNQKYQRPNGDKILAAPQATGGLKGVIAGKFLFLDKVVFTILFFFKFNSRRNYWSYRNINYLSNRICKNTITIR
jgi:hypothetical protein